MMRLIRLFPAIFFVILPVAALPVQADNALFEKARPVLATQCFSCHSHAANKSKGGLMLDSLASMLHGGDSGPAIVPGKPDESLLIKAIRYHDENLQMPPKGKMSE